jgi:hypothetical protein
VIPHKVLNRLDNDFLKVELFVAVCLMQNGKSPHMDGLPCEFCKAILDIVRDDFYYLDLRPSP